jgi:hypothetical protein
VTGGTGGVAARRAAVRWGVRLFRREWREQALILGLLTVSVAAAIGFASTVGAYLALIAGDLGDIGALAPVPVLHLLAIAVGIPSVAALAGWLLAGREPPTLARQVIE